MRCLSKTLVISFTACAIASPSFAGDDREGTKWDRDKKEQRHYSKKHKHSNKDKRLRAKLDILVDALVVCPPNSPERFVDNGDGTICDHETGLMWEKKGAADGAMNLDNPQDVDNRYTWSSTGINPDGAAFTDFLARLNGVVAGTASSEQLGGYNDWRLPTSWELQTIRDCSFDPVTCINPVFGPTIAADYWTSTTDVSVGPNDAWLVDFSISAIRNSFSKGADLYVRAVRGGP